VKDQNKGIKIETDIKIIIEITKKMINTMILREIGQDKRKRERSIKRIETVQGQEKNIAIIDLEQSSFKILKLSSQLIRMRQRTA
jgi:hypothetical protein